jgi:hypothetical protein
VRWSWSPPRALASPPGLVAPARAQDLRFSARVLLKDAKSRMPEARRGAPPHAADCPDRQSDDGDPRRRSPLTIAIRSCWRGRAAAAGGVAPSAPCGQPWLPRTTQKEKRARRARKVTEVERRKLANGAISRLCGDRLGRLDHGGFQRGVVSDAGGKANAGGQRRADDRHCHHFQVGRAVSGNSEKLFMVPSPRISQSLGAVT